MFNKFLKAIVITHENCLDGRSYWATRARSYMAQYHEDLKERATHGTKRNISDKAKKQIEELQSQKQWTDAEKFIEYLRKNFPPKTGQIPPLPEDASDAKKRKKIVDSMNSRQKMSSRIKIINVTWYSIWTYHSKRFLLRIQSALSTIKR